MSYSQNGFRDIERAIKAGEAEAVSVTLLCGDEAFLVEHYEKKLRSILGKSDSTGLNESLFFGSEADDDEIVAALETLPLLADYRVVTVRDHSALGGRSAAGTGKKKTSLLQDYVKGGLPEHARLILSSRDVDRKTSLYKALTGGGAAVYEFGRLDTVDLKNFIAKRFKAEGVSIGLSLTDMLIERSGYHDKDSDADLYKLAGAATKTAIFTAAAGRGEVSAEDVESCVERDLSSDIFAMLDALSTGRKAEAVTLLSSALALGTNVFMLASMLIGQFEIMLGYKEMKAKAYSLEKMAEILSQKSTFRLKKLAPYTDRYTYMRLAELLLRLYTIEKEVRLGNIAEKNALLTFFADA